MGELTHSQPLAGAHPRITRLLGDELLARLVGRGSNHAFALLCERHSQALHRYCRSILHDEHDAQDALQSTMTLAYAALQARERDVSLRAWLFRIAHNESVTILRRRTRESSANTASAACDDDPHGVLESRARLSQLIADLHALPERQRATLVMRELSGLDMPEIAQALGISRAAVKQALFEARNSLRDLDSGRKMECNEVRTAISLGDRRVLRGRRIAAHLKACENCEGYRSAVGVREADLRVLVPVLPAPAIGAMLARAFGTSRWARGASGASGGPSQELLAHTTQGLIKIGTSVAILAAGAAGAAHLAGKPAPPMAKRTAPVERRPPERVTSRLGGEHLALGPVSGRASTGATLQVRPATARHPTDARREQAEPAQAEPSPRSRPPWRATVASATATPEVLGPRTLDRASAGSSPGGDPEDVTQGQGAHDKGRGKTDNGKGTGKRSREEQQGQPADRPAQGNGSGYPQGTDVASQEDTAVGQEDENEANGPDEGRSESHSNNDNTQSGNARGHSGQGDE